MAVLALLGSDAQRLRRGCCTLCSRKGRCSAIAPSQLCFRVAARSPSAWSPMQASSYAEGSNVQEGTVRALGLPDL